ncbi:glycoside hydrolase family 99-like domain-containing protein [Cupriavidus necator]|nr:glycoside hydrolase family 99-like domain-containing protein [Cupriavidus necator]UIF90646.1 glycoside hydrolase family 99-like domain-containing protein [Cupriavidus necator]
MELDGAELETAIFLATNSRLGPQALGGSKDPLHDESISDPDSFEAHLREGAALMEEFPRQTKGVAVICCWNEFGEGSVIEPTTKYNFSYLEKIRSVFGRQSKER